MGYKRLPFEFCESGAWPRGPFRTPTPTPDGASRDVGLEAAAATAGRLAGALANRRKGAGWSRAMLARQSGVGQHTIGRIETGRTWPDLATVARLAQALGMSVTMAAAGAPDPTTASSPAVPGGAGASAGPLRLGAGAVSAAQAIDLIFAHDPRLAAEVSALAQNRRRSAHAAATASTVRVGAHR